MTLWLCVWICILNCSASVLHTVLGLPCLDLGFLHKRVNQLMKWFNSGLSYFNNSRCEGLSRTCQTRDPFRCFCDPTQFSKYPRFAAPNSQLQYILAFKCMWNARTRKRYLTLLCSLINLIWTYKMPWTFMLLQRSVWGAYLKPEFCVGVENETDLVWHLRGRSN